MGNFSDPLFQRNLQLQADLDASRRVAEEHGAQVASLRKKVLDLQARVAQLAAAQPPQS